MNSLLRVTWWPNLADVGILLVLLTARILPFLEFDPGVEPFTAAVGMYLLMRLVQAVFRLADDIACGMVPARVSRGLLAVLVTVTIAGSGLVLWDLSGAVFALGFCYWLRKAAVKAGLRLVDMFAVVTGWTDPGPAPLPEQEQQVQQRLSSRHPMFDIPAYEPPAYQA